MVACGALSCHALATTADTCWLGPDWGQSHHDQKGANGKADLTAQTYWGSRDLNPGPTDYEPATWRTTEEDIVSFDPTKPRWVLAVPLGDRQTAHADVVAGVQLEAFGASAFGSWHTTAAARGSARET